MEYHFAFVLLDNFVHLLDFVIENYFCYMTLSFVLEIKFVLIVVFVRFVRMVQKNLVDR